MDKFSDMYESGGYTTRLFFRFALFLASLWFWGMQDTSMPKEDYSRTKVGLCNEDISCPDQFYCDLTTHRCKSELRK